MVENADLLAREKFAILCPQCNFCLRWRRRLGQEAEERPSKSTDLAVSLFLDVEDLSWRLFLRESGAGRLAGPGGFAESPVIPTKLFALRWVSRTVGLRTTWLCNNGMH